MTPVTHATPLFRPKLRPYQQRAVDYAARFFTDDRYEPGSRSLLAAPCGSGKGTIQLEIQRDTGAWIMTPSLEIIRGFLERLGDDSGKAVAARGWKHRVTTPKRLVGHLARGFEPPRALLCDEAHGLLESNSCFGDLLALAPDAKLLGFTATPFRTGAAATSKLWQEWGAPKRLISLAECVAEGYCVMPTFVTVPLCDDDKVRVRNGELDASDIFTGYRRRLDALAYECRGAVGPVVVSVTNAELGRDLQAKLPGSYLVTQATTATERRDAYEASRNGATLIQVRVLSTGVDLPWLRTLVDAQPTLSPVLWQQTVGRIMRPWNASRKYVICTNRNIERWGWLMEGMLPAEAILKAQIAFEAPTTRALGRAFGFEILGRLKPVVLPLLGGGAAQAYALTKTEGHRTLEYLVMMHPAGATMIATRASTASLGHYGKWIETSMPEQLDGFKSSRRRYELTEAMQRAWKREARSVGLDPEAEVDARVFACMKALRDCRRKM